MRKQLGRFLRWRHRLPELTLGARLVLGLLASVLALAAGTRHAAAAEYSDVLLDILLEKGVVTEEEAARARALAAARMTNAANAVPLGPSKAEASKWRFNQAIKSVELFGDIRLRYEGRRAEDPDGGHIELDRLRYSLRLGLRGEATDNVTYGLRLETAANPRSPWVTLGTSSSSSGSIYQGPFGKSSGGVNIGQLYLGYHNDWLEVTAGKMQQPLYTTPMMWDSDITPEGLAERFNYTVGDTTFFTTFGQFLYQDTNPTDTSKGYFGLGNLYPSASGGSSSLVFLLAWQAGLEHKFKKDVSFKAAPVLYTYTGRGTDTSKSTSFAGPGFSDTFVGQGATNGVSGVAAAGWSGYPGGYFDGFNSDQTGINDLLVLEIPAEVDFKLGKLGARVYGDFAYNLQGADRARAAYSAAGPPSGVSQTGGVQPIPSPQTHDTHAYLIGFGVGNLGMVYGQTSRKGTWEGRVYWQHVEQYALDPNLLDSDFFEGRGNLEGVYSALAYSLTDNVVTTLRYGWAHRINDVLGTGGSNQDMPWMNPIQNYQLLQLDVTMKF